MKTIDIYSGTGISEKVKDPLSNVQDTKKQIDDLKEGVLIIKTNQPDIVNFAYFYTEKLKSKGIDIECRLFLDGIRQTGLEPLFEFYNKALDFITEHSKID